MTSLLPRNSTQLERVLENISQLAVESHEIKALDNPITITEPLLPWLAWAEDVMVWPKEAKSDFYRGLTNASWNTHRQLGTVAGLKSLARFAGSDIVNIITPPAKTYLAARLTKDERNEFLSKYPEIRWFRTLNKGLQQTAFTRGQFLGDNTGASCFPALTEAVERMGEVAYFVKNGQQQLINDYTVATEYDQKIAIDIKQVRIPGRIKNHSFCAQHPLHTVTSDAKKRLFTARLKTAYTDNNEVLRKTVLNPGLRPIDVRYDRVYQQSTRRGLFTTHSFINQTFYKTTADLRIFKQIKLFDPAIPLEPRGISVHLGGTRLGMPAYHAALKVSIRGNCGRHARGVGGHMGLFLNKQDHSALKNTLAALRSGMSVRDKIIINTQTKKTIQSSSLIKSGEFKCGQLSGDINA